MISLFPVRKNTKNWYTIDALGAIFAILTILDTFTKTFTILLLLYYNTLTILSYLLSGALVFILDYYIPSGREATLSNFSDSKALKRPNMCFIFEKHGIQGFQI